MNTSDDYTPNPPNTMSERMGATEGNDWTPVRVPGGDQGVLGDRRPDDAPSGQHPPHDDVDEVLDAYDETTGG